MLRLGDVPGAIAVDARRRAALGPEELALHQALGDVGAAHLDEGTAVARAVLVDHARQLRLAGPGLAGEQHRLRGRGGDRHLAQHRGQRLAPADETVESKRRAQRPGLIVDRLQPCLLQQAVDDGGQVPRHHLHPRAIVLRERRGRRAARHVEDAPRAIGADRRAQHRLDARAAHAVAVAEARVEDRRRGDDRAAAGDGLGNDPARDRRTHVVDAFRAEPVRDPPARALGLVVVVVELEVALLRAGDLDQQAERFREERLEGHLVAEIEQAEIQIAFPPEHGGVGVRRRGRVHGATLEHRPPENKADGRLDRAADPR